MKPFTEEERATFRQVREYLAIVAPRSLGKPIVGEEFMRNMDERDLRKHCKTLGVSVARYLLWVQTEGTKEADA